MKKFLSVCIALFMALTCFTACGKDEEEVPDNTYSGILTKVKLGMPLKSIVRLQPDNVELYYETDTSIWSINPDTELSEAREYAGTDNPVYYVEDSVITYNFKTVKGDDEIYLKGYLAEANCCLKREDAEHFFASKGEQLAKKHGVEAVATMTGTEDVDLELTYIQRFSCSSYTVTFTMKEKFDTIEGVEGYYGSYLSIEVVEKEVKAEVDIKVDNDKEKDKKDKKEDDKKEEE